MKYFITGVPGTGKTTIGKILKESGYKFIDVDHEPGLSSWYDQNGNKVDSNPDADENWYSKYNWYWNREVLETLLEDYDEKHVFVCGMTSNQVADLDLFSKTFLLKITPEELRKRRKSRKKPKDKVDDEHDFSWHKRFNEDNLKAGAILIDANKKTQEVIDDILSFIK